MLPDICDEFVSYKMCRFFTMAQQEFCATRALVFISGIWVNKNTTYINRNTTCNNRHYIDIEQYKYINIGVI